jgi:prefoldin subunit 5
MVIENDNFEYALFCSTIFLYFNPLPREGLKKLSFMLLLLAFSTMSFNTVQTPAYASPFELAYDDGKAGYGWSDFYPSGAAVLFSPPSVSWRITAVKIHAACILKGPASLFYIQIWDAGLNTRYSEPLLFNRVFKNATLDWYTIQLPNIVVTGDFYVVIIPMFTLDGAQLWISVDNNPPFSNTSLIMNTDKHTPLLHMNATSVKPGDFMVRVVGEPAPTLPELRLASIEFNDEETVVVFTYPGEVSSAWARLTRVNGDPVECRVSRDGLSITARVNETGLLNVLVETVGGEVVGAGLRINASLGTRFKTLSANYTALKESSEVLRRLVETLEAENENLRTQARDLSYAVNTLQKQVWGLMENNTKQNQRIAELDGSIERLRLENTVLLTLLIMALAVPLVILTVKKLRVGK